MTIYSDPKFSMMEFIDPPQPLSDHAMEIRRILGSYYLTTPNPDDPDEDSLRYSEQDEVTHATAVLLDALVIPYYMYVYNQHKYQMEYEDYSGDGYGISNEEEQHVTMLESLTIKMEYLIKWKRSANGSIVLVTNEGDVSMADIGIVVAKSDVDEFFKIVAQLSVKYGYENSSIRDIISIARRAK